MNSNWFKLVMKMTKVEYGKNLLLKGVPIIFNKGGAKLKIGENVTIKSSFLSNLVGLYSRTIIVTRAPGAAIEIGDNVGISGARYLAWCLYNLYHCCSTGSVWPIIYCCDSSCIWVLSCRELDT